MMDEDFNRVSRRDLKRLKDSDLFETVEEVFDTKTLLTLYTLIRRKVFMRMNGVISAGKESRVYLAYGFKGELYALKIYLTSTAVFKKGILKYITGDPRFEGFKPSDTRRLIYLWARKEYGNLVRMYEAGVKVPKPITFLNNVLVMEFQGVDGRRYPLLVEIYNDLSHEEIRGIYESVLEEMVKIVCKANLVHGDMSEYNIMVKPDLDIVVIDVSQAVDLSHPNMMEFLKRDLININRFFGEEAGLEYTVPLEDFLKRVEPCLMKRKEG